MNRTLAFSALVVVGIFSVSCRNRNTQVVLPATELAFCDFVLGGSFNECYENADNSQKYHWLSRKNDGYLDHASFISVEIPRFSSPDDNLGVLRGEIEGYQDRIYSISFISYGIHDILEMYQAKYGTVEPRQSEYDMGDYHYNDFYRNWVFENGVISICETHRTPLHYTLHGRDDISVTYYDNSVGKLAKAYKTELEAQRDSIKRIDEERKRLEKEEKEQEKARIKEEKQNRIIESLRF